MLKVGDIVVVNKRCFDTTLVGTFGEIVKIEPIPIRTDGVHRVLCRFQQAKISVVTLWMMEYALDLCITVECWNSSLHGPNAPPESKDVDDHLRQQMDDNLRKLFS